jgi:hypothetical protein
MDGGLAVFITSPVANATVGRSITVFGSVDGAGSGHVNSPVTIHFGGTPVAANGTASWSWTGLVPNGIRPGATFDITVNATGVIVTKPGPEPVFEEVSGSRTVSVVLENVVPVLTVKPFQSPIVVTQFPYKFTLAGTLTEGNGPPYGVPQLTVQVGTTAPVPVAVSGGAWSMDLSLQPGDYPITVTASDAFASVTTVKTDLTVLQFNMPAAIDPQAKKTLTGVPTTASITTWTRLEPLCDVADIGTSTSARLFDPLWMMTRQWQMGEFQAEDAGSPVQARVRATSAPLSRYHSGPLTANTTAPVYNPAQTPLETLVERRPMRSGNPAGPKMLPLLADAGQHFLHILAGNATAAKYAAAFLTTYALLPLTAQQTASADAATIRLMQALSGRIPDASRLAMVFQHIPYVPDPSLKIAAGDLATVQQVAGAWLTWYNALFAEPSGAADDSWTPDRLEYSVSVAARFSAQATDSVTLSAGEFDGGRLDWHSFDGNETFALDSTGDSRFTALNAAVIPAPVHVRGTPAARFWEVEDAKLAYGLLPVGPTDLAHLIMIEYASSYGNDWFVVPMTIPVGTVTRVDSIVVTDTFGVRNLLRPIGDPALPPPYFSMWQQSRLWQASKGSQPPVPNLFFLAPTLARSIDGAVLEDVMFLRDEMADLAWGVERSIESPAELSLPLSTTTPAFSLPAPMAGASAVYSLSSPVPDNWIPLLPVELMNGGVLGQRLKRGAVLQPDGSMKAHAARGTVLNAGGDLLLYDEEVPREGTRVTTRRRMSRWMDGSTWVWTAFRNEVGRGEGSAGLRFDQLQTD